MQFKNETQRLKYYLASYQYLMKYKASNTTIYYNILVMFEKKMEENVEFNKTYAQFKDSEDVFVLYNEFFQYIDHFMRYQNKNPTNIIKISDKLYNFAKNPKILALIKNSSSYSYEVLLLRYIFEIIAVKSLNSNYEFLELSNFDEYLEYHFANDNFLLIHYGLVAKDCTIVKSSYDFRKYLNYCLDNLFPSDVRQFGKEKFIISINTNNFKDDLNIFEYVVINFKSTKLMEKGFIESFYMKYISFPSIDSGEVLISGHYLLGNKDVLIFKKDGEKEILITFSEKMGNLLKISPEMVANFIIAQKFFFFGKMFNRIQVEKSDKKTHLQLQVEEMENDIKNSKEKDKEKIKANQRELQKLKDKEKEKEEEILANLNFNHYLKTLSDFLRDNSDIKNPEKILESFQAQKNLLSKLTFILNKKYEIDTEGEIYIVYYVVTEKNGNNSNEKKQEDEKQKFDMENNNFNNSLSRYVQNTVGDVSSVSGSSIGTSKGNRLKLSGREKLKEEEKLDFEKLKIFSNVITGINGILLVLGFLYLILLLINDNKFTQLFNLFQRYKYFMRGVQTEEMRLVSNICIQFPKDAEGCNCYYQTYAYALQEKLNIEGIGMDVSTIIYKQFKDTFATINNHYLNFKQNVFDLSQKYVNQIEAEKILIPSTTSTESEDNDFVKEETFLEGINVFLNYLVQVINSDSLRTTPIKFFTVGIDYKVSGLDLTDATQTQRNIYSALMNYPFVERALLNVQNLIKSWFSNYLQGIEDILIGFTVAIFGLNFVLIGVTIFFIYEFISVLNRKLETVKAKFASVSFMKYFKSKFMHLKTLLSLYEKTPMEIVNKINIEKDDFLKASLLEKKEEIIIPEKVQKKLRAENLKSFAPLAKSNISIIVFLYVIYYTVSVILFICMKGKLKKLRTVVDFVNYNAEIDNDLSLVLNSLQIMIITNTSQYDFGYFIKNNASLALISYDIQEHLFVMKMIKHIEQKDSSTYSEISQFDHVSCEDLRNFEDSDFITIIPSGEDEKYYNYLTDVCNALGVMEYQRQDLVMNNIIFLEEKLLKGILKVPYNDKLKYLDQNELYEIYSLHLVIMRIIRSYLNESALPKLTTQVLNAHKKIFIICLSVNLFMEFVLMILLYCLIPKKLLETNTKVGLFIYYLD